MVAASILLAVLYGWQKGYLYIHSILKTVHNLATFTLKHQAHGDK